MGKGIYINSRGNVSATRPIKDVPLAERQQILIECMTEPGRSVRERHNISNTVLSHIRFYHGKSKAKQRGYYHLDLLDGVESPESKIQELKEQGMTSGQVSIATGIPLEKVNKLWG